MTERNERPFYSLPDLLTRFGLEFDETRGKMDCPFCGGKRKINLKLSDDYWRCAKCGDDAAGGVLHFYARYGLGMESLPPDKAGKGKVAKLLREFMEGVPLQSDIIRTKPPKPKEEAIPVASDEQLHKVYSAMAKLPSLQLQPQHKDNLLSRGLSEEAIQNNGYCSMPESVPVSDFYIKLYEEAGGEHRRSKNLDWIKAKYIRFGIMIAHSLVSQGLNLRGVPGFFKFGHVWCFWCVPGILIPTRNLAGQIVIWQVRKDTLHRKGDLRYITVSNQKLPGHVTESVSRCHFPLSNTPLEKASRVIITEGPLKADVALHLYRKPVCFLAIPGISTTKDMFRYVPEFKKHGHTAVYNALDMDRFTNPNVRSGSETIKEKFKKQGIELMDMYWGTHYAVSKYTVLAMVARYRQVPVCIPPHANAHERLNIVSAALDQANIATYITVDGKEDGDKYYWEPESKGIDDFLKNFR